MSGDEGEDPRQCLLVGKFFEEDSRQPIFNTRASFYRNRPQPKQIPFTFANSLLQIVQSGDFAFRRLIGAYSGLRRRRLLWMRHGERRCRRRAGAVPDDLVGRPTLDADVTYAGWMSRLVFLVRRDENRESPLTQRCRFFIAEEFGLPGRPFTLPMMM